MFMHITASEKRAMIARAKVYKPERAKGFKLSELQKITLFYLDACPGERICPFEHSYTHNVGYLLKDLRENFDCTVSKRSFQRSLVKLVEWGLLDRVLQPPCKDIHVNVEWYAYSSPLFREDIAQYALDQEAKALEERKAAIAKLTEAGKAPVEGSIEGEKAIKNMALHLRWDGFLDRLLGK